MEKKDNFAGIQLTINIDPTLFLSRIYLKSNFLKTSNKLKNKKFNLNNIYQKIYVGLHPSCLNSFGKDKKNIVDNNLRIKKFSNLFVCGSDVFPSNGFTNPTWTIMTFGTRLSYFLKKKFN